MFLLLEDTDSYPKQAWRDELNIIDDMTFSRCHQTNMPF
jgi:hypothetical protein